MDNLTDDDLLDLEDILEVFAEMQKPFDHELEGIPLLDEEL